MSERETGCGALSAEYRLRQAVDAVARAFAPGAAGSDGTSWLKSCATAGAVLLVRASAAGGLAEMAAAYRTARDLMGAVSDWTGEARGALMSLEAAYNAALSEKEERDGRACLVRHKASGLFLAVRFNELADDCGMLHMRWMAAGHSDTMPRAWCAAMAAAFNLACGRDVAEVVEVKG